MILSEEEAFGRWCFHARGIVLTGSHGETIVASVNRWDPRAPNPVGFDAACIGRDCMAWRWTSNKRETGYCGAAGPVHTSPEPSGYGEDPVR